MTSKMTICIDPGHGMGNVKPGKYDPGAVWTPRDGRQGKEVSEAEIVMDWANELRHLLMQRGHTVIRTRKDALDPAPVGQRASIALQYNCDVFISLHCNCADGTAHGTETFYRGKQNAGLARACNDAVVHCLGSKNRGIKTEEQSQHTRLAVLNFPRAVLIELGFIDHAGDRTCLRDEHLMLQCCEALADAITS